MRLLVVIVDAFLCLLFLLSLLLNLFFVADNVNCPFVVVILNVIFICLLLFATVVVFVFVIVSGVFFVVVVVIVFVIVSGVFFVFVVVVVVVVYVIASGIFYVVVLVVLLIVNGADFELLLKKNEIKQIILIVRCENVRQLLLPVMIRNNKNLKEKIYCFIVFYVIDSHVTVF